MTTSLMDSEAAVADTARPAAATAAEAASAPAAATRTAPAAGAAAPAATNVAPASCATIASSATVAAPRYLDAFRCVGPACEETCCSGWRVELDAATVRRYRTETRDTTMALQFRRHVKAGPSRNATGTIRMLPDGSCPFLDAERLCSVQSRLGEAALSDTCADYPRSSVRVDGALFVHAAPSCPEVARLLAEPDAMEPAAVAASRAPRGAPHLLSRAPNAARGGLARHAGRLQQAAVQVLGFSAEPVQPMLIGYGILLQRVERAMAAGDPPALADLAVQELCEQFTRPGNLALVASHARQLRGSSRAQFALVLQILDAYRATGAGRPSFKALIDEALAGLGVEDGADAHAALARFEAAEADRFEPFDRAHRHVLRHYAVNDAWRTRFPAGAGDDCWSAYFDLAVRLAMLRFLLVGLAARRQDAFGVDAYVKAIQTLSRNIQHSRTFMPDVLAQFRAAGLATFGAMALMLTREGG